MSNSSRLPALTHTTVAGASAWFAALRERGFLFHPEDDPADIICLTTGAALFSKSEVAELRISLAKLDTAIGQDNIIDAACPVFMGALGLPCDA